MDLQKISDAKTAMEQTFEKIYCLQEAIIARDNKKIKTEAELLRNIAHSLYIQLIESTIKGLKVDHIERSSMIMVLGNMAYKCGGVEHEEMFEKTRSRKRRFVLPRQVHMSFAVKTFGVSLVVAGNIYGLDHTTVLHAIKTVRDLWQTDADFRRQYDDAIEYCLQYDVKKKRTYTIDYLNEKE